MRNSVLRSLQHRWLKSCTVDHQGSSWGRDLKAQQDWPVKLYCALLLKKRQICRARIGANEKLTKIETPKRRYAGYWVLLFFWFSRCEIKGFCCFIGRPECCRMFAVKERSGFNWDMCLEHSRESSKMCVIPLRFALQSLSRIGDEGRAPLSFRCASTLRGKLHLCSSNRFSWRDRNTVLGLLTCPLKICHRYVWSVPASDDIHKSGAFCLLPGLFVSARGASSKRKKTEAIHVHFPHWSFD